MYTVYGEQCTCTKVYKYKESTNATSYCTLLFATMRNTLTIKRPAEFRFEIKSRGGIRNFIPLNIKEITSVL